MTKKVAIWLFLTIVLLGADIPMSESRAESMFNHIKSSEYRWVLSQWRDEMQIKTRSRSSSRRSSWSTNRGNDPLRTLTYEQYTTPLPPSDPITLPNR